MAEFLLSAGLGVVIGVSATIAWFKYVAPKLAKVVADIKS